MTEDAGSRLSCAVERHKVYLEGSHVILQMWNAGPWEGSTPPEASSP